MLGIALPIALGEGQAVAHPEIAPTLVNRYLTAAVVGDALEVSFTLLYGALPAADERRRLDGNGDGRIAAGELASARERWEREAGRWLDATLDGERLVLQPTATIDLGGDESAGAAPVVVELRSQFPLARAPHRLRLEGGRDPERAGELELSLVADPTSWTMLGSTVGRGEQRTSAGRHKFEGPRRSDSEDRSVTFWLTPAAAAPNAAAPAPPSLATRVAVVLGAAAAFVAAAFGLGQLRRRKRRR